MILKDKIGEEPTSYIIIAIAGVLGFIGFVKIHELPAEKILPYWARHYLVFAKPIHYMTDKEYEELHQKKNRKISNLSKEEIRKSKLEISEMKKEQKRAKILEKARKKYGMVEQQNYNNLAQLQAMKENRTVEYTEQNSNDKESSELTEKLSKLSKEQQELLLKLLER